LHTAYTYVDKQCVKISCNLEMVTRMAVAHFKWNDPNSTLLTVNNDELLISANGFAHSKPCKASSLQNPIII